MSIAAREIAYASAFFAGTLSFLSPCVLPLVPGYVSFVAGRSLAELRDEQDRRRRIAAVGLALCFVLGFSAVFVAMGAAASAVGQWLGSLRFEAAIVAGIVVALFGIQMTGLLPLPWLERDLRPRLDIPGGRPLAAGLLGAAFAFGWSPCIGPILGAILTLAGNAESVAAGVALLMVYAAGLAIPFLIVAAFTDRCLARFGHLRRLGRALQIGGGTVLILAGAALATGTMGQAGTWLLINVPFLQRIAL